MTTKTERIKEETGAVGTMVGTVTEWQNMKNIRGHRLGQRHRGLLKRLRLLEQSLDGKMWKIIEVTDLEKDRED